MSLGYIGNSLPAGWETPLLTDLVTPKQWRTISTKELIDDGYIVYGANGKIGFYSEYTHEYPTLMITCRGATCGNLHISDPYSYINGNAMALDGLPDHLVDIQFLYYALKARGLVDTISGSAQPQITGQGLKKVRVPLPSFSEQKIIVDKLDTLLAQVDSTKACLEKIPHILKRFRQAVLVAAVSGHLTEEWRAQNPEQTCTKVVSLGDIIIDGPQNGIYKPSSLYGSGHKIVRIDSFYEGVLSDWNTFKRVQLERSEVEKWSLRNNDILINRVNSIEYLGKCGLVENLPEVTVFESNIMRITLNSEKAVAKFVTIFLSSILGLTRLRENAKLAVNQASINQKDVKSCKIELPCISEQTEIVRRVEQFFAYADTIEKHVQNALERVNNLTQSILSKAVRGEFTAQWRAENPELISGENSAQSLLLKIQQQRTSIKNIKHRKGKS